MSTKTLFISSILFCCFGILTTPVQAKDTLEKAHELLNRWRADEADTTLSPLHKSRFPSRSYLTLMGRIRYYQGRYEQAIQFFNKAFTKEDKKKHSIYHSLLATTKISKGYGSVHSPHFTISFPKNRNRILAAYAIQALEKAYQKLGKLYGYYPPGRVHVQILQSALQLAAMSPLTQADIVRTGTIALCKYNRIMLTSPIALLRGYRWLDTLVHEYTHLVINRIASGVPIWLHEGLARYSEILWRSETPQPLSPYSETLLAKAIRDDTLIPFKKMHPSMAKLPSQKDAALAYAQVYQMIKFFVQRKGRKAIPQVLQLIQSGIPVPKAFEKIVGMPFRDFYEQWKNHLRNSNLRIYKNIEPEKKILKGQRPKKTKAEKARERNIWYKSSSPKELGRRHLQLGELLRAKGRNIAAIFEYLKAEKYWKNQNPSLQNKIARTYFRIRQHAKAIPHLQKSLKIHPNYVSTYVHLGRAYYATKKFKKARKMFEEVNEINPFHPTPHRYLIAIYEKLKRPQAAKRETDIYKTLRTTP